ncbi:SDR family NAD(P)-dependent oxidoreductase [Paracraurococcus lichenis]|uniref:SDR family oxidoreductase n=1 Tax=Paracraurococcus lichenis TaxID=3064888 RepID=A0ABT9ECJ6_9PROT|nr:SDR family oxidoreductase [Paracraurococcus sp. LOR1-02]MDO9713693.1 SDR family oxidoreductase [Paracraurococcus sp. LOR1-02]
MAFDFGGKRVVVAGASRGIGRAIALSFARAGAGVSICARGAEDLARAHSEIAANGHPTHSSVCDLADRDAIFHYVEEAASALGGIDVLVNNASAFGAKDDEEGWAGGVSVDLMATVRAGHAARAFLERGDHPCIINISSVASLRCGAPRPAYAAMKAAVNNYTVSLAGVLAPRGIRVNAIAPGSVEFPGGRWERARLNGSPLYQAIRASIPFGRMGEPEEIADAALFLASPYARWITGQVIAVDGGENLQGL